MMDIAQWSLNLAFVGAFIFFGWVQKRSSTKTADRDFKELVRQLESRIQQLETELHKFHDAFQEKIKEVDCVVEQANRLLKSSRAIGGGFPLTQEESELKEAIYFSSEKEEIPSVAYLENTKIRLQKESNLDLKTLLKGQLS